MQTVSQTQPAPADESFSNLLARNIFPMLDQKTLLTCQLVSKSWRSAKRKHEEIKENKLLHSLENYSSIDISTLDPKDSSQALRILLKLFQFPKLLRNSLEMNKWNICEFKAIRYPPHDLHYCLAAFAILSFEPNEYTIDPPKDIVDWRDVSWRGIMKCLLSSYFPPSKIVQKLTAPEFFLKLSFERFDKVRKFLKESPITLKYYPHFKDLRTWIYYMCECGVLMSQLSGRGREFVEEVYTNCTLEITEELAKISYRKKIKDSKELVLPKKCQEKLEQVKEEIQKVNARMKEKDLEILVLKHALQNLQHQIIRLKQK